MEPLAPTAPKSFSSQDSPAPGRTPKGGAKVSGKIYKSKL